MKVERGWERIVVCDGSDGRKHTVELLERLLLLSPEVEIDSASMDQTLGSEAKMRGSIQ